MLKEHLVDNEVMANENEGGDDDDLDNDSDGPDDEEQDKNAEDAPIMWRIPRAPYTTAQ